MLNRDGRYCFRRPIPANLRPAFEGRIEFKHSLRTASKSEARAKAEHLTLQTSEQLDAARRRLFPEHQRTTLTKDEARHLAKLFASKMLGRDEDARMIGDRDELDELADHYGNLDGDLVGHRLGLGEAGYVRREATSFALEQGVPVLIGRSSRSRAKSEVDLVVPELVEYIGDDGLDVVALGDPEGVEEGILARFGYFVLFVTGIDTGFTHVENRRPAWREAFE